jgi:hypothetical protein
MSRMADFKMCSRKVFYTLLKVQKSLGDSRLGSFLKLAKNFSTHELFLASENGSDMVNFSDG